MSLWCSQARTLDDIDPQELDVIISKYGEPIQTHFATDFLEFECNLVKESTKKGRYHDITCFIQSGNEYVVIQKHAYANTGIYRAPSGGANSGEPLEDAAKREMYEETGLEIELLRFVLDSRLDVVYKDGTIPWRSLVFLSGAVGGEMGAVDTHEIYEVRTMSREDILGEPLRLMEESGWGGFKYRAFLTRAFFEQLDLLGP
ncbi:MAG: NUDIX hydrolase [Candidatus Thorarchaeota archaeon]